MKSFSDYEYNDDEDSNSDIYEGELNICLYFFQFFLIDHNYLLFRIKNYNGFHILVC